MKPTVINVNGLSLCTIPKCAGSSLRRAVLEGLGYSDEECADHHHPALNLAQPEDADGFCAALIRHPFDRLVSCWADKIRRFKPGGTPGMIRVGYRVGMPFNEFAEIACKTPWRDAHTRRQVDFLPKDGPIFLGRLEQADEFWRVLRGHFDWLPKSLGRHNESDHQGWRRYIKGDLYDLALAAYGEDLNMWYAARCA